MVKKARSVHECSECGYSSPKWLGRCPECGSWGSMEERTVGAATGAAKAAVSGAAPTGLTPTSPAVPIGKVQVQWLGQAATRITTPGGKVIVIDPWLTTNPKTPEQYKKLEALGRIDLILVTHAHILQL